MEEGAGAATTLANFAANWKGLREEFNKCVAKAEIRRKELALMSSKAKNANQQ